METFELEDLFAHVEDDVIKTLEEENKLLTEQINKYKEDITNFTNELIQIKVSNYRINNKFNEQIKKYDELQNLYNNERQHNKELMKNIISLQGKFDNEKRRNRRSLLK